MSLPALRRELSPSDDADAYLLIHLDDLEFGEDILFAGSDELEAKEYTDWCQQVAADILRVSERCKRKLAITVDQVNSEDWMPELNGMPLDQWQLLHLEPHDIPRVASQFRGGERVIVGGVTRHDCVQRAIAALRRAGCEVIAHETAILPWTQSVLKSFVSR